MVRVKTLGINHLAFKDIERLAFFFQQVAAKVRIYIEICSDRAAYYSKYNLYLWLGGLVPFFRFVCCFIISE